MKPWPGGGFAPAKPVAGGHAEVNLAGKGRGGNNAFLGGALGRKKQQAIVVFTWPGGSTSRTIKGNMTIRYVMEWCSAFNAECERLGARNSSDVATESNVTDLSGNGTAERAPGSPRNIRVSDEAIERDPEVQRLFQAHRALMKNPHRWPPDKWTARMGESLEALSAAREAVRMRLGSSPVSGESISTELDRLARLHATGALDDQEFRAAKKRVLRST
jgi:hypothetical protein